MAARKCDSAVCGGSKVSRLCHWPIHELASATAIAFVSNKPGTAAKSRSARPLPGGHSLRARARIARSARIGLTRFGRATSPTPPRRGLAVPGRDDRPVQPPGDRLEPAVRHGRQHRHRSSEGGGPATTRQPAPPVITPARLKFGGSADDERRDGHMPVVPPALPARRSVTMRCWPLFAAAAAYLGTTGCVPACQLCRPSLALAPAGPGLVQTLPIQMQKNRGACASIPSTKRPPTRARPFDPNKQCQGRYHLRAVKQARRHQVAMRPVRRDAPPRSVPCAGHRREGSRWVIAALAVSIAMSTAHQARVAASGHAACG